MLNSGSFKGFRENAIATGTYNEDNQ